MSNPDSGVRIGDVSGGIHGSIIAGRDVKDVTITVGGQSTPADKTPTAEELKTLLDEIRQELAALSEQKEALKQISAASPFTAQGAAESVAEAAKKVAPELPPEEGKSVQKSLTEATSLLEGILDGAKSVAEKAGEVGKTVKPIAETLAPLVEKLAVAALWAGKLWLSG